MGSVGPDISDVVSFEWKFRMNENNIRQPRNTPTRMRTWRMRPLGRPFVRKVRFTENSLFVNCK